MQNVELKPSYRLVRNLEIGQKVWLDPTNGNMYLAPTEPAVPAVTDELKSQPTETQEFLAPGDSLPFWNQQLEKFLPNLEEFHPNPDDYVGQQPECPHCGQYLCSPTCYNNE